MYDKVLERVNNMQAKAHEKKRDSSIIVHWQNKLNKFLAILA